MIIEGKDWEFKYVSESAIVVQKLLNQWKHEFKLVILASEFDKGTDGMKYLNLLIARRRKE